MEMMEVQEMKEAKVYQFSEKGGLS